MLTVSSYLIPAISRPFYVTLLCLSLHLVVFSLTFNCASYCLHFPLVSTISIDLGCLFYFMSRSLQIVKFLLSLAYVGSVAPTYYNQMGQ